MGTYMGFTRRIEEVLIDMDSMAGLRINPEWVDGSPNGLYTVAIVPSNLKGRVVLIMALDEDGKVEDMKKSIKDADLRQSKIEIMKKGLENMAALDFEGARTDVIRMAKEAKRILDQAEMANHE